MWNVEVYVSFKEGLLDPEGKAVQRALNNLGYHSFNGLRSGKYFQLCLDEDIDRREAEAKVDDICKRLLSNPIIEDYSFDIQEVSHENDEVWNSGLSRHQL